MCWCCALDMLSRLKGIETLTFGIESDSQKTMLCICFPVWRELKLLFPKSFLVRFGLLWICFPVWRELKLKVFSKSWLSISLCICFPVWRELKLAVVIGGIVGVVGLWICFPVWRELKRLPRGTLQSAIPSENFGYAFPFEGNWNLSNTRKPKALLIVHFGYAFPFEGNWNATALESFENWVILWICFPVWRELKLE